MINTYDADMVEWRKLRKVRMLLEPVAYVFERANPDCKGDCENPKVIYVSEETGLAITCCNLLPTWERYHETRKLERVIGSKLNVGRKPFETTKSRTIESPLKDAYERTHTATYVGRKLRLSQTMAQDPPSEDEGEDAGATSSEPKVRPKEH